ncbi:stage III sporulation protein AA [Paenibacillus sp. CAA11]|uniref:stage III sporulation protein AA n=1 Tax=Paenibacillus sp. CAA11 TaxID=1532905 RepID=UPI000D37A237|nr:stage III sporulation protein AA [Paenibacillus sp. CAA11]AWB45105.1 stage III sporulation protein AA [Paenibacillus sp. CAA11]
MNATWLTVFPEKIKQLLQQLSSSLFEQLEEIRFREGRPFELNTGGSYYFLTPEGGLTRDPSQAYCPDREEGRKVLDLITNHSLYTMEEELRKGFITLPGGHRVGLAGRTVLSGGRVEHIREISSFNLRIAREIRGAATPLLKHLLDFKRKNVLHTLIISPPQQGKTTMLRDLARQISSGSWGHSEAKWSGLKVAIVDERSEIAGCRQGVPSFDLGPRTDVMDACPKAEGMMMMLRSMSPEVIIVDEIGRAEDAAAIAEALHAGVSVVATVHGAEVAEVLSRPFLSSLAEGAFFQRFVILSRAERKLTFRLLDGKQRPMLLEGSPSGGGWGYA